MHTSSIVTSTTPAPTTGYAVQAYDSDGIGKGDGSGGPRITRPEIALYEDRKQTQSDGEEFIDVQDGESEAKLEEDSE